MRETHWDSLSELFKGSLTDMSSISFFKIAFISWLHVGLNPTPDNWDAVSLIIIVQPTCSQECKSHRSKGVHIYEILNLT